MHLAGAFIQSIEGFILSVNAIPGTEHMTLLNCLSYRNAFKDNFV